MLHSIPLHWPLSYHSRHLTRNPTFMSSETVRSLPIAVGTCAMLGATVGALDAAGGSLTGDGREHETIEAREERRQRFFKPKKDEPEAVTVSE